jgi:hypothetical protein
MFLANSLDADTDAMLIFYLLQTGPDQSQAQSSEKDLALPASRTVLD